MNQFWVLAAVFALGASASASTNTSTYQSYAASFDSPVGIGGLAGNDSGHRDYSLIVEGQSHFKQRAGLYGFRQYGEGESRLELGSGVGVALSATSGIIFYGLREYQKGFSPFLGAEPFSGRIAWNSSDHRARYYEWLPMASAGLQYGFGTCRVAPVVRAGGSAGNIVSPGITPSIGFSYGVGAFLNCASFDLALAGTRIRQSSQDVRLVGADLAYSFSPGGFKIGVRGESELADIRSEQRVLLVLRTRVVQ